jgi:hypothetical protein
MPTPADPPPGGFFFAAPPEKNIFFRPKVQAKAAD